MTEGRYVELCSQQSGACAICGRDNGSERLAVDHDHITGRVRALLCRFCNAALGMAGEEPARLRRMADYVERGQS